MWFEYHCWESEDSTDAELWHHTHQWVKVVRELTGTDDPMFHVEFNDGSGWDVFDDELLLSPKEYIRPSYLDNGE